MFTTKMKILILVAILILRYSKSLDMCDEQKSCEDCIKKSNDCIWCAMDNVNDHCKSKNSNLSSWCLDNRVDPSSGQTVQQDLNFSSDLGNFIQVKPQKIKLDLRPGQRLKFDFSFKNAKDYPVDIYFLLDGSNSMATFKNTTVYESEKQYKELKAMTSNVFLGMGTFVDKNALPFTLTKNSTLTYSFKNHLKLTDQFEVFKKVVNDTPFGLNYDEQEGTFDALAQVIACKEEIGWRNESRKIIIVQTVSPFHAAGDGKWAGIVKPNDGKCYTEHGVYTKELEMDYPSVSLINKLASDEQMTIIFAVSNDMYNLYEALSHVITGSRTSFDYNTLEILRSFYEEITSNLKIRLNMKWDYRNFFKITTDPDCLSESNDDMYECELKQGEEKIIEVSIELLEYIPDVDNVSIDLVIEGIKEKLSLDVNFINKCNCSIELNSPTCSSEGSQRCGICECNEGRWGDKCQCSINNSTTSLYDTTTCQGDNSTEVCNGHGFCYCGACVCRDRYEGRYCECNKDSCPRGENGGLCSDHGTCQCGQCKCNEGWSGDACSCEESINPCMEDNIICNNRGTCSCGSCECQQIAPWDARNEQSTHCVVSPCYSCNSAQCNLLKTCAICKRDNHDQDCPSCFNFNVTVEKNVTEDLSSQFILCSNVNVAVGCDMKFWYKYASDRYSVDIIVQSDLDCAKSYYMYGGGVLAGLVAIGITSLLLWKCISDAKDKREYKRFLNEVANSNTACDNPIYAPATTTFSNPAFRKRSIY